MVSVWAWAQTEKTVYERVYVQTDKPLYLAGELVWVKMLLTDEGGRPFAGSKVGYVELLDKGTAQVQAKLELADGVGEGWMMIPLTLPTGNYSLVGYTRYMRNEGEAVFFEKTVPVVNTFSIDKTIELPADSLLAAYTPVRNRIISLQTDRSQYMLRSGGEVRISGLPADMHSLSVSIAGRERIPLPAPHGIANWKEGLASLPHRSFPVRIVPEYEGHILHGQLTNVNTGAVANVDGMVPLLGFVGDQVRLFSGQVDKQGNVTFVTKRVSGTHEIVTALLKPSTMGTSADVVYGDIDPNSPKEDIQSTAKAQGEPRFRVDIQSPFAIHEGKTLPELQLHPAWNEYLLQRSVGLQVLHGFMADSMSNMTRGEAFFQWQPTNTYRLDEYTRFTTMEEVVIEFIPSLRFRRINGKRHLAVLTEERLGFTVGNSLVLLDGVPVVDHENIFRYDPLKVEKVDIYRGKYLFGGQQFNGIASFSTYGHDYAGLTFDPSTQFFDYEGAQAHRVFYAPAYDTEAERKSRVADYRHTLLWMPDLRSNGQQAVTVPFTTSDLKGEFVITVEGLTRSGEVVSASALIKVD